MRGASPHASAAQLLGSLVPKGSWWGDAICSSTDPDAFYPEKGGSTREAKRICRNCPVRTECLAYAISAGEPAGVWGGMSERERRRLAKAGQLNAQEAQTTHREVGYPQTPTPGGPDES